MKRKCNIGTNTAIDIIESERGSIIFFVSGIVIPLLFFLSSLSLDLAKFYSERERMQELLDSAAMRAVQSLPYQKEAGDAARNIMEGALSDPGGLTVYTESDAVLLTLSATSKLSFLTFFGIDAGIPYTLASRARISPIDSMIVVDNSGYLSPAPGTLWGDPGSWPASLVFNFVNVPPDSSVVDGKRYMTQKCMNPPFTALKTAAITVFDYVSSVRLNSVGLGFAPGDFGPAYMQEGRPVKPGGFINSGGDLEAESVLSPYTYTEIYENTGYLMGDANCAAIIDQETFPGYKIPELRDVLDSPSIYPGQKLSNNLAALGPGAWQLNPLYTPYVSARESIWARSTRLGTSNISDTVNLAASYIRSGEYLENRGGLALSARKALIMLEGDLPHEGADRFPDGAANSAVAQALAGLDPDTAVDDPGDIELYMVVLEHEGNTSGFSARISRLEALFANWPKAHLVYGNDPQFISTDMINRLGVIQRSTVLSK